MAFKYVPHTFRDGEIIEPTRVLENMRVLASEFNGKLNRDNFPEEVITDEMMKPNAVLEITQSSALGFGDPLEPNPNSILQSKGEMDWDKFLIAEKTLSITHDSLLIVSFNCELRWIFKNDDNIVTSSSAVNDFGPDMGRAALGTSSSTTRGQCFIELRVNGELISESSNHTFLRQLDSVFVSGATPVLAGDVVIDVKARIVTTDQNKRGISIVFGKRILNTKLKKR